MKYVDIEKWNRKTTYEFFKDYDDPFFNITANLDVTALSDFCKQNALSLSLANLFYSLQTANEIREFRLRLFDDRVIEFDKIHATQTILNEDETFSFCYFEANENIFEFNETGKEAVENYKKLKTFDVENDRLDLLYFSVIPWISFTSFKHAVRSDNKQTVPRMVFGRMFDDGKRKKIPHSVEVHHALVDGFHVGKYFNGLQDKFSNPV
ncbi:MAG: CatA-like O-acetyltransferase [Pyrinomonadaceae bacterium]